MSVLIRDLDWASGPLGPIAEWPPHLCAAVGLMLNSRKPITLLWGEGGIMIYNDAYAVIAGGRHPACLGQPLREAWPEVADFNDRLMRSVLGGEPQSFHDHAFTFLRNGAPEEVFLTLDYSPVPDAAGCPAGVMAIVTETTDKVIAERGWRDARETLEDKVEQRTRELQSLGDELRQAQKMEAIGQLTGGIAHDFNNLLTTLKTSLDVLQMQLRAGDASQADRYLSLSQRAVDRAASLTQRLLAFSRRQALNPQQLDLQQRLAEVEELICRTMGPSITVQFTVPRALWPVRADGTQLDVALLNLCINARDAMQPDGGTLLLEASNVSLAPGGVDPLGMAPGDCVCLEVRDTGCGMSADTLQRAVEPFFTTKPPGQGTGLGLSMVYAFAQQSGGQLRIESVPGQGTVARVYLPRVDAEGLDEDDPVLAATLARPHRPQARLLLIDDEASIRELLAEQLAAEGYRVATAGNGHDALALLQGPGTSGPFDLLIADVGLPGSLSGRQIADSARRHQPALRVLFITGYADGSVAGAGHADAGVAVLSKPFSIEQLITAVGAMLARP